MTSTSQNCLNSGQLAALAAGELEESLTEVTVKHLEVCDTCREALAELESNDPILKAMRTPGAEIEAGSHATGLSSFLKTVRSVGATLDFEHPSLTIVKPAEIPHFERYRILKKAGRGGMGTVYIAEDMQLGRRKVALKVPLHDRRADLSRFQREAETLAQLDHPQICPIYDVNLTGDEPYLALKFIDGETLAERLEKGRVETKQAIEWSVTIGKALAHAHSRNVIHRDLKPGNVMIDAGGNLWLMDFGLSKLLSAGMTLTQRGDALGTPGYMAPEQIDPNVGEIGPQTDLFSLGALTYELLTGNRAFPGSPRESMMKILGGGVTPPSKVRPDLDPRLDAFFDRALAKAPRDRFGSADEFIAALREITVSPPQPALRRRVWTTAAAIAVALGLGVWAMSRPGNSKLGQGALPEIGGGLGRKESGVPEPPATFPPTPTPVAAAAESPMPPAPSPENRPVAPSPAPLTNGPTLDNPELASQAVAVLEKYCFVCHANDKKYPGLDMRDQLTLFRPADPSEAPFLVSNKPDESRVWQQLTEGLMPPEDQPQPTATERNLVRSWIEKGAVFPPVARPPRTFVGEQTLLVIIDKDLTAQPQASQAYLRYLSLTHLWNSSVDDEHLQIVRAAVSKLMNSLSGEATIVPPAVVDADGLVLRIDLRDYGWRGGKQWADVSIAYPYGLVVSGDAYRRVTEVTGDFPYIRADWFVHAASRPPLYHQLVTFPDEVGLPETQSILERFLAVDAARNYDKDLLRRAAFTGDASGVSDHNRLVERHRARYGYYWPSYDFSSDTERQSLFRHPLGPKHLSGEDVESFEHDGGELIFSLPNDLQGYMLVKSDGTRIDKGPQTIVSDPNRHSGGYDVVNGISCMGCHRHGMVRFTDTLRPQYVGRSGEIADKVLRLYPDTNEMSALVEGDRKRFLSALDAAIGPFLRVGKSEQAGIEEFPEPISTAARPYGRDLKLADVARELGLPADEMAARAAGLKCSSGELATLIRFSNLLRDKLSLGPVAEGGAIPRQQWEHVFGRTARELGLGTPKTAN